MLSLGLIKAQHGGKTFGRTPLNVQTFLVFPVWPGETSTRELWASSRRCPWEPSDDSKGSFLARTTNLSLMKTCRAPLQTSPVFFLCSIFLPSIAALVLGFSAVCSTHHSISPLPVPWPGTFSSKAGAIAGVTSFFSPPPLIGHCLLLSAMQCPEPVVSLFYLDLGTVSQQRVNLVPVTISWPEAQVQFPCFVFLR